MLHHISSEIKINVGDIQVERAVQRDTPVDSMQYGATRIDRATKTTDEEN
jgi:hypothetical protein